MQSVNISIRTLTPLFTGGIDGTAARLHETSIIGSLRWWYELIVRGLGGIACDQTINRCTFDIKKYNKLGKEIQEEKERLHKSGLCDACQIFGATGRKRQFKMNIFPATDKTFWRKGILNVRPAGRHNGWYLPSGFMGDCKIRLYGTELAVNLITSLFFFLEEWGAIGAKNQLGYGLFKITNKEELKKCSISEQLQVKPVDLNDKLIFFKYTFSPSDQDWWTGINGIQRLLGNSIHANILYNLYREGMVPIAPVLKNFWRYEKWHAPYEIKSWLMGMSRGEKKSKSKVSVSWAYRDEGENKWTIRGWIWLPENRKKGNDNFSEDINKFIELIKDKTIWIKSLNLKEPGSGIKPAVNEIINQSDFVNFLGGGAI